MLEREVPARNASGAAQRIRRRATHPAPRNASGAAQRIRWAGFPARKTLDDFDWDHQPAVRQQVAALASGAFLAEACNVVLLGPPGTGKPTSPPRSV